ncbi:hypothetical protein NBRC13296_20230 [Paenibacillus chitinolyticus]|uniref:hypothetical protein n=1 Tax=Paenibacillus chitinolyticus TaxID=79263 RepID=UPI003556B1AE
MSNRLEKTVECLCGHSKSKQSGRARSRSGTGLARAGLASSLGQGSLGQGSLGQGSLGQGSLGQGSLGQGSLGQGSLGQGSLGHKKSRSVRYYRRNGFLARGGPSISAQITPCTA